MNYFNGPVFRRMRFSPFAYPRAATASRGQSAWRNITDVEYLYAVFCCLKAQKGRSPGQDGLRYEDFSQAEIYAALRRMAKALKEGTYRPHPVRRLRIPKPAGGTRELRLLNVLDRVIAFAVHRELLTPLEAISAPCSHGGRIGRDRLTLLAALERQILAGRPWVGAEDICQAFDNVSPALLHLLLPQIAPEEPLRRLIELMIEKPNGAVGIDQGHACSMDLLNLLLNHHLDGPLTAAYPSTPRMQRYVDDLTFAASSAHESETIRQRIAASLRECGMTLKASKRQLANLNRQGAAIDALGLWISKNAANQLEYGISKEGWKKLENNLAETHLLTDPIEAAQQVIRGWLEAQGPAFALENVEPKEAILDTLCRKAERLGMGEACAERETLRKHALRGSQRWEDLRRQASGGCTPGTGSRPSHVDALRDVNSPPSGAAPNLAAREPLSRAAEVASSDDSAPC